MRVNTPDRFWVFVARLGPDDCWEWMGCVNTSGYGQFAFRGKQYGAHRFAYELIKGPIPTGLHIDHICHTRECSGGSACPHRRCMNPAHLVAVTARQNIQRGNQTNTTHCGNGHLYTPDTLRISRDGWKYCRICQRTYTARWREKASAR